MKFSITKEIFQAALQKTINIAGSGTAMPILNNLFLQAEGNLITIFATNMELSLRLEIEGVAIEEAGEVTLPAKKLFEMVREINGEVLQVEVSDKNVATLCCEKSIYHISGCVPDDFPYNPPAVGDAVCFLNKEILLKLFKKTAFAISTDTTRTNINGALLEAIPAGEAKTILRMVATDGYRLAQAETDPLAGEIKFVGPFDNVIIPRKAAAEIVRLLEASTFAQTFLYSAKNSFSVSIGKDTLTVKLIDGEYPDYKRIVPTSPGEMMTCPTQYLRHVIRRLCVVSSDTYNAANLRVIPGMAYIDSQNSDIGDAEEAFPVTYHAEVLKIRYNVHYLAAALNVIGEENVTFEINKDDKPTIIRGTGDDQCFSVVMPLRQ